MSYVFIMYEPSARSSKLRTLGAVSALALSSFSTSSSSSGDRLCALRECCCLRECVLCAFCAVYARSVCASVNDD